MTSVRTIISGAQTGADRGALEAAHDLGLRRGGWAPWGWRSEDGEIPLWYRTGMTENGSPAYRVRTRANVEVSGGTLILSLGELTHDSGSMLTANLARRIGKPHLHMFLPLWQIAIDAVRFWLTEHSIRTLNVAGPRESREPGVQAATRAALVKILRADDGFGWDP
jgi:hypothetical protein